MDLIEIKFIPTGNIFLLPADEATRIVNEDRGNYQVIKGTIKLPKKEVVVKTVKEMVVDDSSKDDNNSNLNANEKQKNTPATTKAKNQNKNKENK
ncbi:hypothetical protein IJX73_00870 [bacterium]|nr:hypothetical protein [bacterium]MBQ9149461.1 hypothetical protein [bacterium]